MPMVARRCSTKTRDRPRIDTVADNGVACRPFRQNGKAKPGKNRLANAFQRADSQPGRHADRLGRAVTGEHPVEPRRGVTIGNKGQCPEIAGSMHRCLTVPELPRTDNLPAC
jgi:hypothetical protein